MEIVWDGKSFSFKKPEDTEPDVELAVQSIGWDAFPYHIRNKVMEQCERKDAFSLAICSSSCYNDLISSKDYIKQIELTEKNEEITMAFSSSGGFFPLFNLVFSKSGDSTKVTCFSEKYERGYAKRTHWVDFSDESVIDVVIQNLKKYIERVRQNLTKFTMKLSFHSETKIISSIQLRNFEKLEVLDIETTNDKTCLIASGFIDFEQASNVSWSLCLPSTNLSFDQLIRIKAEEIDINLMNLTPDDLSEFMKYWRDGRLNPKFKHLTVKCSSAPIKFNLNELKCLEFKKTGEYDLSFQLDGKSKLFFAMIKVCKNGSEFHMNIRKCEDWLEINNNNNNESNGTEIVDISQKS